MTKRRECEKSEARIAREEIARDAGWAHFKKNPDLMLIEVHRHANRLYGEHYEPAAFVEGYTMARAQRDAFLQEQRP